MFDQILFLFSAFLTVTCALLVVATKNLMHSCIFLLGSFFGISGLYVTLGADFLAATQLVVYAGGVVILMLFAVMLTGGAENKDNRFGIKKIRSMGNKKTFLIAGLSTFVVLLAVTKILINFFKTYQQKELPALSPTVDQIGTLLITDHVLAFEISSILLLGALIGAAVIARPRQS